MNTGIVAKMGRLPLLLGAKPGEEQPHPCRREIAQSLPRLRLSSVQRPLCLDDTCNSKDTGTARETPTSFSPQPKSFQSTHVLWDPVEEDTRTLAAPGLSNREDKTKKPQPPEISTSTFRQRLHKPLPPLPVRQTADWTKEKIETHILALKRERLLQVDGKDPKITHPGSMSSARARDSAYLSDQKVAVRRPCPPPLSEEKVRDEQALINLDLIGPSPKHRKGASVATFKSSDRNRSTDTHRSSALLEPAGSPKRRGSIISALRGKAGLVTVGSTRTSKIWAKHEGPIYDNHSVEPGGLDKQESSRSRKPDQSEPLSLSNDKLLPLDQKPCQLSSTEKTPRRIIKDVVKKLDSMYEHHHRGRLVLCDEPDRESATSGTLHIEKPPLDQLYDIENPPEPRKMQSLIEALREGPPVPVEFKKPFVETLPVLQTYDFVRDECLRKKATPQPLSFRKNRTYHKLPARLQPVLGSLDGVAPKELCDSPADLNDGQKKDSQPVNHSAAHYDITSPASPFATIKYTGHLPHTLDGPSTRDNHHPFIAKVGGNDVCLAVDEAADTNQLQPRAATAVCVQHGPTVAKKVVEDLQLGEEFMPYLKGERPKSKTWPLVRALDHSRPSVRPQEAYHSNAISFLDQEAMENPNQPPFSNSISMHSLQAGGSSPLEAHSPNTVVNPDATLYAPTTPTVIRVCSSTDILQPPFQNDGEAEPMPILTHESLASYIATLDLGPPPPIPPRHPARAAESSDSPPAKPLRRRRSTLFADGDNQLNKGNFDNIDIIRANATYRARTTPVPSPSYIDIKTAPSLLAHSSLSSSSLVTPQPLEDPFLRRSASTHSVRGHPSFTVAPIIGRSNNSGISRSRTSTDSHSQYTNDSGTSRCRASADSQLRYTKAISSVIHEIEEMRRTFHLRNASHGTTTTIGTDILLGSRGGSYEMIHNHDNVHLLDYMPSDRDTEKYSDTDKHLMKNSNHTGVLAPRKCSDERCRRLGGTIGGEHCQECEYWKALERAFGTVRPPPPKPPVPFAPSSHFKTASDVREYVKAKMEGRETMATVGELRSPSPTPPATLEKPVDGATGSQKTITGSKHSEDEGARSGKDKYESEKKKKGRGMGQGWISNTQLGPSWDFSSAWER